MRLPAARGGGDSRSPKASGRDFAARWSRGSPPQNTTRTNPWFDSLGWSDRHAFRGNEVGSLQPNSVPFRGHINHFVVRNFFAFGHMLDRAGEREGDA